MKKILSMLVVVSIVALSAMGAFAADYLPDDNGRYTVVVENLQPGEMYGMVAIKGTQASQITEANIVYIDQATADSEGKISFTSFGTMGAAPDAEDFVEATVFVGGAGYASATAVGTLKAAAAPEPEVVPVTKVTLNETAKELEIGGTVTLVATVEPDSATDKTVTWESSAPAIAEVVDGLVTAKAAGEATITAKAGDVTATCVITVNAASTTPEVLYGDIDGNGKAARSNDLIVLERYMADWPGYDEQIVLENADLDGNGKPARSNDLVVLERHMADWPGYETLPVLN